MNLVGFSSILLSVFLAAANGQQVASPVRSPVAKAPTCQPWSQCNMCEVRDCNVDDDCKRNLICAQQHQEQLKKRGLDIQKGRCYNTIPANYTLCIPPKWLVKPKKECEIDCDEDYDCVEGLLCAEAHRAELKTYKGLDFRKVYCKETTSSGPGYQGPYEHLEVCYDPNKLKAYNKTRV